MKKVIITLMMFLIVGLIIRDITWAAETVENGTTNHSVYMVFKDGSGNPLTTCSISAWDLYYVEYQSAISAKADLSSLTAADAAHSDNKAYHVGQGLHRVDVPDAAFDGGIGTQVTIICVDGGGNSYQTAYLTVELSPAANAIAIDDNTTAPTNVADFFGNATAYGRFDDAYDGTKVSIDDIFNDAMTATTISTDVWAYASRELTDIASTTIATEVWNNTATTTISTGVWAYTTRELTAIASTTIATEVWNNTATTTIAAGVWAYTPSRTLTDLDEDLTNIDIDSSASVSVSSSTVAQAVWEYLIGSSPTANSAGEWLREAWNKIMGLR